MIRCRRWQNWRVQGFGIPLSVRSRVADNFSDIRSLTRHGGDDIDARCKYLGKYRGASTWRIGIMADRAVRKPRRLTDRLLSVITTSRAAMLHLPYAFRDSVSYARLRRLLGVGVPRSP